MTGSASATWVESVNYPGKWDRHTTVTVKNPIAEPVILQGVYVQAANGYLERVYESIGAPLGAGESFTFENIVEGNAEKHFTPVGVGGIEFIPQSAPDLFCIADPHGPPFIRDNSASLRLRSEPTVMCGSSNSLPSSAPGEFGKARFSFGTDRWFPGLKVRFHIKMVDGMKGFSLDFPRNQLTVTKDIRWEELGQPYFSAMLAMEWDGGQKTCGSG